MKSRIATAHRIGRSGPLAGAVLVMAASAATGLVHAADTCRASAGPPPIVVELYTSEGCSSCPPADHWASTLKGRSDVLTLAFHVNYWDRLGWPDRFASDEATQRQVQLARSGASEGVYTPQVLVNGRDWQRWPGLPETRRGSTGLPLQLQRDGEKVVARLAASPARPLGGYWAVLEDAHMSRVRAGENKGETLHHDHVVRLYQPVAAFSADHAQRWELTVSRGVPEHPRRAVFVVTDATTQRPVQALALPLDGPGC